MKTTKTENMAIPPEGALEGAPKATGGGPSGDAHDVVPDEDIEVIAQKTRRKLTAHYKLKILQQADQCVDSGEIGRLLRREGLYSSSLTRWRRLRDQGLLQAMSPKQRGRKPVEQKPLVHENASLRKENQMLRQKLSQAERIIEVQKKISQILKAGQDLMDLQDNTK